MGIQNIVLLIAGLLNITMSIFIISRGWRNKVNLYFSLLTFFNFLWILNIFIARSLDSDMGIYLGANAAYVSALGIIISLYYFSLYYPVKSQKISNLSRYSILFVALLFAIGINSKGFFIIHHIKTVGNYELIFNDSRYIAYTIFFLIVAFFALYNFMLKFKIYDTAAKSKIKYLITTISVGLIFGSYFDLALPFFGIWKYVWLGPIFTVFMNLYVFYLVFDAKKIDHGH